MAVSMIRHQWIYNQWIRKLAFFTIHVICVGLRPELKVIRATDSF